MIPRTAQRLEQLRRSLARVLILADQALMGQRGDADRALRRLSQRMVTIMEQLAREDIR